MRFFSVLGDKNSYSPNNNLAPPKNMASQTKPLIRKNINPAMPSRFTYFFTFSVSITTKLIIFPGLPKSRHELLFKNYIGWDSPGSWIQVIAYLPKSLNLTNPNPGLMSDLIEFGPKQEDHHVADDGQVIRCRHIVVGHHTHDWRKDRPPYYAHHNKGGPLLGVLAQAFQA